MPAIVFVNFNHFVVVEGFRNGRAYVNDPARGRRTVDAAEFDQAFTGVVLTFERSPEFKPGGEAPSVLRSLTRHLEGFKGAIAAAFIVGLLLVLPGLVMPWLLGRFVDEVLVAHLDGIAKPLLTGLIIAAVARSVLLYIQAQVLMDTFGRAARTAAKRFLAQALALPMTFYSQRSSGEIAARVDLNERVAGDHLARPRHPRPRPRHRELLPGADGAAGARLTLIVVGCVALELFAWRDLARRTGEGLAGALGAGRQARGHGHRRASRTSRASRRAARRPALYKKWLGLQIQFLNASIRRDAHHALAGQVPAILGLIAHLAVLGIGAYFIMAGSGFTIGDLVAFQVLLAGFTLPVHALFAHTAEAADAARRPGAPGRRAAPQARGGRLVTQGNAIATAPLTGALEVPQRHLRLQQGRGAPHRGLLAGGAARRARGARGRVGIGQVDGGAARAGLYHPWSGEILFDGRQRAAYERAHLANAVAYVDQDVALFEGTVRENLTLWEPASDDAVNAAIRDAAVDQEVLAERGGLDAAAAGRRAQPFGRPTAAAWKIARAVGPQPRRCLILDEATSALDPTSEAAVETEPAQAQRDLPGGGASASPPCAMPTRSWCWSAARSSSAAGTPNSWKRRAGATPRSSPTRPPTDGRSRHLAQVRDAAGGVAAAVAAEAGRGAPAAGGDRGDGPRRQRGGERGRGGRGGRGAGAGARGCAAAASSSTDGGGSRRPRRCWRAWPIAGA
jgi:ABC-type transport system involved in cytochrome c biogenesis ATPase subunit